MTLTRTQGNPPEEVHTIAARLANACRAAGLSAEVLSPTRVSACVPDAYAGLAEIVTIRPDEDEVLSFYWSWGELICPATDVDRAVNVIKQVVTPPVQPVS